MSETIWAGFVDYGTIKVIKRRDIEAFSTVFHAVSTIQGRLREEIDFVDCLKAIFPGGSITGAPKISAMKIINELEPTARGLYTGSIGWIDLKGNVCLNIAIRTIIIRDNLLLPKPAAVSSQTPMRKPNGTKHLLRQRRCLQE